MEPPDAIGSRAALDADLLDNRERRVVAALVLDLSIALTPHDRVGVELELADLRQALQHDRLLGVRIELAAIACGERVQVLHGFASAASLPAITLPTGSNGALARGVAYALDLTSARRRCCQEHGIDVGSSWVWCVTASARIAHETTWPNWLRQACDEQHTRLITLSLDPTQCNALDPARRRRWFLSVSRVLAEETVARTRLTRAGQAEPLLDEELSHGARPGGLRLRGRDCRLDLAQQVHCGRSATLWSVVHEPAIVVQLFRRPARVAWERIEHLAAAPFECASATWQIAGPIDIVLDRAGARVGFAMSRIVAGKSLAHVYCRRLRATSGIAPTPRERGRLAVALAQSVAAVHARGDVVLGSLDEQRVLIDAQRRVWLTGLDHAQVHTRAGRTVLCDATSLDHLAPELFAAPLAATRTPDQDVPALAVLIHALLCDGAHPFDAITTYRLPSARLERQRRKLMPGSSIGLAFPPGIEPTMAGGRMRELWSRTFLGPRSERPRAADWVIALQEHARGLSE